ncbi:Glutathione transferase, theta class [Globisporangium polare]
MSLKLYANLISQPCRAVAWVLKVKQVDYELVLMNFGSPMFKSPEFLAMNPNGFVPVLQDDDFALFEGNAILTYLADKFAWTDLYPTDPKARAKVNEYLHWHHGNARLSTTKVIRPMIAKILGGATPEDLVNLEKKDEVITNYVELLEKFLVKDYVAQTDAPTIADYALYCEVDQLEIANAFDFSRFPKTSAWIARMKQIPFHDEVHEPLVGFIDAITPKESTEGSH